MKFTSIGSGVSILVIGVFFLACNTGTNKESTAESAKEANEQLEAKGEKETNGSFLIDVYSYNLMLISYGELAQIKASTGRLKDFAQKSVEYHKKSNTEIKRIAQDLQTTLPKGIGQDVQEYLDELAQKEPKDFESSYIKTVDDIQDKMIKAYERAAEKDEEMQIRKWAETALPSLRAHELTVNELRENQNK